MRSTSVREPVHPPADRDFVAEYASRAPLALALERSMECQLYIDREFDGPILDVGCGDGCFIEVLFGRSVRIDHGLDPDPQELERARRRGVYVDLLRAPADHIPLPDDSIGTVMSNSTLEHIPDLDPVLHEIFRVLRPSGRLYITVPTDKFDHYPFVYRLFSGLHLRGLAERFRRSYNAFWKHHHYYRPDEWRLRLERSGFEVEEVVEYASPLRCLVHDLLVPAALPAFLVKKVMDRYFVLPTVRRIVIRALRPAFPRNARQAVPHGSGGLVFLVARKPGRWSARP